MIFLYSDDGLHCKHNKTPHKMTRGGCLIQVKITKKDKHGTATVWPWPLNRGGRLIQVTNTAFV